ncbi:flagellar biosynthesis anti-sigma factor FlgM [Caldichromatium japonicum]|uniref:Negative regulator of flagellin synthesis n=1 Tax=Caldichromatium japonicum TaxID=2699430 RepID=A0A6G7VDM2_9GAMM|nr:flagellar biosynthesis anti-sigma factor FlgM [Caldichromatium japonicum]QIK37985.1 flagellar biosynthesis anti-sigma factor FlgM [Caldichromatium japonicum]
MDIKLPIGTGVCAEATISGKARSTSMMPGADTAGAKPTAEDSVTLTAAAKTLSTTRGEAQDMPVDEQRIAAIRTAIAEGRYEIDNWHLAQRILGFERSFA